MLHTETSRLGEEGTRAGGDGNDDTYPSSPKPPEQPQAPDGEPGVNWEEVVVSSPLGQLRRDGPRGSQSWCS